MASTSSFVNRIFFLTTLSATILALLWVAFWSGKVAPAGLVANGPLWHGHEMILGFLVPAAIGLLAVGRSALGVTPSACLLALWLVARLTLATGLGVVGAVADVLFLLAIALIGPRPKNPWPYWAAIAVLLVADCLVLGELLGQWDGLGRRGLYLAVDVLLVAASYASGRLLPEAAHKELSNYEKRPFNYVDWSANAVTALFLVSDVFYPFGDATTALGAMAFFTHLARFWRWRDPRVWQRPSLWILFVGYLWIVAGFGLRVYANLFAFPVDVVSHAFSAGALSIFGYGAIARHFPAKHLAPAFWLINLAVVGRVFLPLYVPGHYDSIVVGSGLAWAAAFGWLAVVCLPTLIGKAGKSA